MLLDYLPVFLYMVIAAGLVVLIVLLSEFLGKKTHTPQKDIPYECGMDPIGDARHRYAVRFYVIAMFFIVFDVEAIFLYPWAVVFKPLGWFGFVEMALFIFVLVVGLAYVWGKGALEWE
jgi:NADH-quinone oxidoreductase subunit A|uniref:NADH-quinone oxidoreductase subunit A n=1 Tax=Desulfobacca acetoxidans TaxID=60893 RepID=A0A7C5AKY6_9BACT